MKREPKTRLDVLLVNRGLFESPESACRAVMAGLVTSDGEVLDKPGTSVRASIPLSVTRPDHHFVSRGGVKLEHALTQFEVDVSNQVVLDVGASTGGFTDCVLQRGARHVHAVDVGYGQFAWKLRTDSRVHLLERTNFRHVDAAVFLPQPTLAVMDVSFISIRQLLPKLQSCLATHGQIVSLVKPQFEAGKGKVGKGGIVRDPAVHRDVLTDVVQTAAELKMACRGITFSPIQGGAGNIEFFVWLQLDGPSVPTTHDVEIDGVVEAAWQQLKQQTIVFNREQE